jgi:hypothetical protein
MIVTCWKNASSTTTEKTKTKNRKQTKNVGRTFTTMLTRSAKAIESPQRSRNASIVAKLGISMTIAGLWKRT